MNIGSILKSRREFLKLSQQQVADYVGVSKSIVSRWENGDVKNMGIDKLKKLSSVLNVDPLDFINAEEPLTEVLPYAEYPFVPDAVAAGVPSTIEGIEELPRVVISDDIMGKYARKKNILIMRVNGESMNRVIENGSIIAVKTDVDVNCLKNGDLVVFNHDYEFSLKRFYRTADRLIFKPDSTDVSFMDISYSLDDDVRIVGKVVMSSISYE